MDNKYCKRCGTLLDDCNICPNCGLKVVENKQKDIKRNNNFNYIFVFWTFLGFCFPQAGLALMFVWKDSKTKLAYTIGVSAVCSIVLKAIWLLIRYCLYL